MKLFLAFIFSIISLFGFGQSGNFSYNLSTNTNTSAGVYRHSDSALIRTIWALKSETAGAKIGWWDGNDDYGNPVTDTPCTIKVLSSNASANWDGVVGNSSTIQTGPHTFGNLFGDPASGYGAAIFGSNIYFASGYGEGVSSEWKTTAANINYRLGFVGQKMGSYLEFLATDGTNMYIAGYDAFSTTHTFVYAHTVPGEVPVVFSSGTNYTPVVGTQQNMIAYKASGALTSNEITGLAVQQSHNYIIVTRSAINEVQVVLKTTGATAQTIGTITSPGRCAIDGSDNVWIADATNIKQYSINSGTGALTATGIVVALTNVGGLSVSPNGTKIAAIDLTNEQVKQYRTSDGVLVTTLGTGVSYQTNPAVANNKFYWSDTTGTKFLSAFVIYMADSSILVGDLGNARVQHFASDFSTFVESQTYSGRDYDFAMDNNNSTRCFIKGLEYQIDYTKSLTTPGSSTLVNNWGGRCASTIVTKSVANQANVGFPVTINQGTFANGRTYALLHGGADIFYCVELVSGYGIRYTGITKNFASGYAIDPPTGDLIAVVQSGATYTYRRYALTGFDGSNNPIWSGSFTGTTVSTAYPNPNQSNGYNSNVLKTSLGNYISFGQQPLAGKHLGSIAEGGSSYKWTALWADSTLYLGPFPGKGQTPCCVFENGNGVIYGGGVTAISGTHIIFGYHGENWKNAQTNYFWQYDDNTGLPEAFFGKSWYDYPTDHTAVALTNFAPAQVTGNALNGTAVVGTDGVLYLYAGEEVIHDGAQRWSITGLNTISRQTATYPISGSGAPALPGTDLMTGFTRWATNPTSGTSGWVRNTADFSNGNGSLTTKTGFKSYDITKSSDLYIKQNTNVPNTDIFFTHSLIPSGQRSNSWRVQFDALWDDNITNTVQSFPYNGGSYIEVLDSAGKIIAETHISGSGTAFENIVLNGVNVMTDSTELAVYRTYVQFNTVTFTYINGTLTLTYQTVNGPASTTVTSPLQSGALMTQPYTLKLHFFEVSSGGFNAVGKSIAVQNVYFNQTFNKGVVIGNGSGSVSLTSMALFNPGDTAYIATQTGVYTSLILKDLTGIVIKPQSGRPTFTTQSTFCRLNKMDVGYINFISAANSKAIDCTCGRIDSSTFHNLDFEGWSGACWDFSGAYPYIYNVDSTYHLLRSKFDSIRFYRVGRAFQGAFGFGAPMNADIMRRDTFRNMTIEAPTATVSEGVSFAGVCYGCIWEHNKWTSTAGLPGNGDDGKIYGAGWWIYRDNYEYGAPDYAMRLFPMMELNDTGTTQFYNNAKFGGTQYGMVNIQANLGDSLAGQRRCNGAILYNNTMGNQFNDTLGYWSTMFNLGQVAPNVHYYVSNNLGFNIGNNTQRAAAGGQPNNAKNPMATNLGGWNTIGGDTSHNKYWAYATIAKLDSTTTLFSNIQGNFPAFYLTAASPSLLNTGITNPLSSTDYLGNPYKVPPDLGYIQLFSQINNIYIPGLHKGARKVFILR